MIFPSRQDAGRQLAEALKTFSGRKETLVLAIPRGGVSVALEIAATLRLPLDIFLSRKLGVPGHEELAFGAVAAGGERFLDRQTIEAQGISADQIEKITENTKKMLHERAQLYRRGKPPASVEECTVILVDDGIATGSSVYAAIQALRQSKPKKIVVAAPVAPLSTVNWLRPSVDELTILYTPKEFYAVGQFYTEFSQVTDEEVIDALQRAEQLYKSIEGNGDRVHPAGSNTKDIRRELLIPAGEVTLEGSLSIPRDPKAIVLFAHGSGSSRYSPRNQAVAETLQANGLATLLFDLLTREEDVVDRRTSELRFNVDRLAERLIDVTRWIRQNAETKDLAVGYFGASTGAAAALIAAARIPDLVSAVVSRGGRPDLADRELGAVRAATLLIVGGLDEQVLQYNHQALSRLQSTDKQLVVIPGATHLFEESGALEQVAQAAAEWLMHYLGPVTNSN